MSQQAETVYPEENPSVPPGSSSSPQSRWVVTLMSLMGRVVRDFLAFLVRGGLSTLMFFMDQVVNLLVSGTEVLAPGPVRIVLTYPARMVTWCFQTAMWVTYTAIELLFYLPPPLLLVYVIMLLGLYSQSSEALDRIFYLMFWSASGCLHFLKAHWWY